MFCLCPALSISLAGKPTMPEGAQMAQSDLRAGGIYFIYILTKSSRRNSSQKKTFNPRGQKVTFSVNGLLL